MKRRWERSVSGEQQRWRSDGAAEPEPSSGFTPSAQQHLHRMGKEKRGAGRGDAGRMLTAAAGCLWDDRGGAATLTSSHRFAFASTAMRMKGKKKGSSTFKGTQAGFQESGDGVLLVARLQRGNLPSTAAGNPDAATFA